MPRFIFVLGVAAVCAAVAAAQIDYFGGFPGGFSAPRDPRDNRGPVTFPVTQPGSETSGVRVGASGYGFVPPGSRGGGKARPLYYSISYEREPVEDWNWLNSNIGDFWDLGEDKVPPLRHEGLVYGELLAGAPGWHPQRHRLKSSPFYGEKRYRLVKKKRVYDRSRSPF